MSSRLDCAGLLLADADGHVQEAMLEGVQDGNGVADAQLRAQLVAAAVGVEEDGRRSAGYVADGQLDADELLDVDDLGQEAPVLLGLVDSVALAVEAQVEAVFIGESVKRGERCAVAEVGVALRLRVCHVCSSVSRPKSQLWFGAGCCRASKDRMEATEDLVCGHLVTCWEGVQASLFLQANQYPDH